MRKHGMFTPHGGDRAQQPQVKHDKRKPANDRKFLYATYLARVIILISTQAGEKTKFIQLHIKYSEAEINELEPGSYMVGTT